MLRWPPGDGGPGAQQRKYILTLAVLLLACLPLVEAQQQHHADSQPIQLHGHSAHESDDGDARIRRAATIGDTWADLDDGRDAPRVVSGGRPPLNAVTSQQQEGAVMDDTKFSDHKNQHNNIINHQRIHHQRSNIPIPNDASAVATLAPAQPVRAPPSKRRPGPSHNGGSGISTPPRARSLEEWEVEDFILLATVDGDLYANDRRTGAQRWHLEVDQPMVETTHHRLNSSDLDDDHHPVDHYIWAVEPSHNGSLYIWMPGAADPALVFTGLTMKQLVEELSPLANDNPPVIYTGTKKTTMITLDAASGRVLKWFGSSGSHVNEDGSCLRPTALYDMDNEECSSIGTITLGRTEYEVAITRKDGHDIAKLRYSEWSPNNFDKDLVSVYHQSLDHRYHSSRHDGRVYAFDPDDHPMFAHKFTSPVARVFDVCRPWGVLADKNPDLIVLPQPVPAAKGDDAARVRANHVFLNQTDGGSWYALSGLSYPLIVDAPPALTSLSEWWELERPWNLLSQSQKADAMVGRHDFQIARAWDSPNVPTLPGGPISHAAADPENEATLPSVITDEPIELPDGQAIVDKVMSVPQSFFNSVIDLLSNPVLISVVVGFLFMYRKDLIRWSRRECDKLSKQLQQLSGQGQRMEDPDASPEATPEHSVDDRIPYTAKDQPSAEAQAEHDQQQEANNLLDAAADAVDGAGIRSSDKSSTGNEGEGIGQDGSQERIGQDKADGAVSLPGTVDKSNATKSASTGNPETDNTSAPEKKKPKAHRGRRAGVKHRKGPRKREASQSRDDNPPATTVDDAVKNAQKLGNRAATLEPDVMTVTNDMQSVTGPVIKLGNIEVDTEDQLGTGSNGTLVFAGKFDGREVAVKRMLIQFYDIASQETRLLRESDDHPNVIRYHAQEFRDGFLYIALERCAASLADVVEKPSRFSTLAQAGTADLPGVLYQITNGINHLHELRIVHRDLKPQNILINMGKDGKPRLLVSDFGLCKKLEGGQSSFGATTGRAAGTSGWRAPELLIDDDKDLAEASVNSGSGAVLVNSEMMPGRRATRSIDIFSLGLVFFYVLTNGLHPFDCGDRYMREVNIRKGNYNLAPLDALGDFSFEAKDLIGSMLHGDPKQRPNTRDVMAHPFFWSPKKRLAFLCDVSDHFEKEPRDPPSAHLQELESHALEVTRGDFLRLLPRDFLDSLGKQRKYIGSRLLDLLRALRNKRNHYEDIPDSLKRTVGPLPEGYLAFWTFRFPDLLLACWNVIWIVRWDTTDRFREYYEPASM